MLADIDGRPMLQHVLDVAAKAGFDQVVVAAHADQALAMLYPPSEAERQLLSRFAYQSNRVVLHGDPQLMPKRRAVWSAWNHLAERRPDGSERMAVTYWMNRLQGLDSSEQYLVTLNARDRIDPTKVIAVMDYEHPIYDLAALEAQANLASLATPRIAFAGAYHGWGFHEDGCRSGVEAARSLGVAW